MSYKPFENLCKYYIDCIIEDNTDNISSFVDSRSPSYLITDSPELSSRDIGVLNSNEFRKFEVLKAKQSVGNQIKKWWYGFPLCYTFIESKKSQWKGFIIKPIFYLPLDQNNEDRLTVSLNSPRVNYEALKDLGLETEESKRLSEELGIFDNTIVQKSLSDLYSEFRNFYPGLRHDNPSNDSNYIKSEGAVFSSEGSPYTQGIEIELNKILRFSENSIKETALKVFFPEIGSKSNEKDPNQNFYSSEVIKLNDEQQSVLNSVFTKDLTVVTGPPGTGKSQVVASIIINASRNGKRVLFASKNQKAVDVVEERLNKFANRPFIIRLGNIGSDGRDLKSELSLYLNSLSGAAVNMNLIKEHNEKVKEVDNLKAKRKEIEKKIEEYFQLRNKLSKSNDNYIKKVINEIGTEDSIKNLSKCKTEKNTYKKILWYLTKKNRITLEYCKFIDSLKERKDLEYLCDEFDYYENIVNKESEKEFELWLNTLPSRLDGTKRKSITNYASVIKAMNSSGANTPKQVWAGLFKQREQLMYEVSGILPAWCVTNLSAKGALPLINGLFDLLVIDEASQCDIPSALPLMFRSKKIVVIGDPNQLQHITSLPTERSLILMKSNELTDNNYLSFEYTNNSLFHCAAGFTREDSIVMLKEHFRSHEDIINFSNKKWYGGNLTVETDYRNLYPVLNNWKNNVTWLDVNGIILQEAGSGAYIENECSQVADTVISIINDLNFKGNLGIVTPFRLQANKIRQKLISLIKNEDWLRTRLLVDTSIKFQGDERDIIIYSPVISSIMPRGAKYYIESTPNLLNVSLTRAKSQLIIVGNKSACLNSKITIIKEFAEYVCGLESKNKNINPNEKIDSPFGKILYDNLLKANIITIPNYKINQYKMDLAFIDNEIKIDIEIEDEFQLGEWDEDKLKKEMVRNFRLSKLGWKVIRIWFYEIRDNINDCVSVVKNKIDSKTVFKKFKNFD